MGKPRLNESTREAKRLKLLCELLSSQGHPKHGRLTRNQMAEMTGVEVSHINKIYNDDRPRGLGADIIRKMRDGLQIDPWFFFVERDPTDVNVYILDEKRMARRLESIEERLAQLETERAIDPPMPSKDGVRRVRR